MEEERWMAVASDNEPVPGCTISRQALKGSVSVFSLAKDTGISAETYAYHKLFTVYRGSLTVFTKDGRRETLQEGQSIITPTGIPVGVETKEDTVYTETAFRKESTMNDILKSGTVFELKDLLPYREGRIVNMDLISDPHMKFVLMSFDAGQALAEHAAPGDALVFALDGKAEIGYEGKAYEVTAGQTFRFDKNGRHSVKALTPFKMALLLTLD
ncbi:MAG TPA: cupin [Lachnospiraceae bacterium]|jgi:quercetin dioxygenase-like cupin family protein|nr:cupin [Lachnospiraceae bacterium]